MSGVCQVTLIGRVGRDPEMRYLSNGKAVVNISVAVTYKRKGEGGATEDTAWHRVTMYERLAEITGEYVRKGSLVYITGGLRYGKYTDKSGVEKDTTEIVAAQMQILSSPRQEGGEQQERRQAPRPQQQDLTEDDIPF